MGVEVDDGQVFGKGVIERFGLISLEKEVLADEHFPSSFVPHK